MIYKIAQRYAFSSKNRHKLTSIRIALGLLFSTLALNVILAFMIELQDQKFSLIREFDSYDAIIDVNEEEDVDNLLEALNSDDDIKFAFNFFEVPTIIRDNYGSQLFGKIRAIKKDDFEQLPYSLVKGTFDSDGILIGYSKTLNSTFTFLKSVDLTILKKGKTVAVVPLQQTKTVSGVYFTPMGNFNNYYAFMDYYTLQKYAPYTPHKIGVYGDVKTIQEIVSHKGTVNSWIDQNESLYAAMKLEQFLMYFTLSLMSLIVLIHLYSSTINLIKSKKSEIAMLRTLGVTKKKIQNIFALSSLIVSTTGIILGSITTYFALNYSNSILIYLNRITSYSIPILSINVNVSFSFTNCLVVALPLFIITIIMSQFSIKKLLRNDSMEILLNE